MDEIAQRLSGGRSPGLIVLHGLGGVGKTSVAAEYAYRHEHEFGLIWQITADDQAAVSAGFAELALLLGARDLVDEVDPIVQVHAVLAARRDRWLLLLDNVTDPAAMTGVIPPAGSGCVLVTSQSADWWTEHALEVAPLDRQVATDYLLMRTGDRDAASGAIVAEEVGYLPLALEQAGAYLHATGRSLRDYLALLKRERAQLLGRGRPYGYDKSVASTWTLAFEQLHRSTPEAIALIRLLACYAAERIPVRLLLEHRHVGVSQNADRGDDEIGELLGQLVGNPLAIDDAIEALRSYSLIGPVIDGAVSVHRLVQAVTLDQLTEAQRDFWRRAAGVLLTTALPSDPEDRENWPIYGRLLAHAREVLRPDSPSMLSIVEYLGASGDYTTARNVQQQVYDSIRSRLGLEHPAALNAGQMLARWTGEAGDVVVARDLCMELSSACEQTLGPEHVTTLSVRHDLAHWTGEAGDAVAARDLCAELWPACVRALGEEHPETLAALHNLARWSGRAGDATKARDLCALLVPLRARVFGVDHSQTLAARYGLARWTGMAGDAMAACEQFSELVVLRERISGPEHPQTLAARHGRADWTGMAGDAAAARDQFAELLPLQERVAGMEHPHTRGTRERLAYWSALAAARGS